MPPSAFRSSLPSISCTPPRTALVSTSHLNLDVLLHLKHLFPVDPVVANVQTNSQTKHSLSKHCLFFIYSSIFNLIGFWSPQTEQAYRMKEISK